MDFLEKERAILTRLEETGYKMFGGSKPSSLDFLTDTYAAFTKYADVLIRGQTALPVLYERYEGQELVDRVSNLKEAQDAAHGAAVCSIKKLNCLCDKLGLTPFADIDVADRRQVAAFVGKYMEQVYRRGQGR